ncbi:MAG: apolipoprotein N-acyltransferase [Candidatus Omnitrophica bacterium]|nr:apolipoprotein N-acyltransferase [Candidatus Omnitrophota bacterium]
MRGYSRKRPFLLSCLAAALLVSAFPHLHWHWLAWVGLVPLFWALEGASWRGAFWLSYSFGFLFYLGTIWWIGYVTVAGMLLLVSYLALFYALFGLFYRWTAGFAWWVRLLTVPAAYVVLEFVRDHALTGFGWAGLGHTQAAVPSLLYLCGWTGVAGIAFLVVFGNMVAQGWLEYFRRREGPGLPLIAATVWLGLAFTIGAWQPGLSAARLKAERPLTTLALVQPNVSLGEMWTASSKPGVVHKLLEMSLSALEAKPDLIIWPETSFPHFYWDLPELFDEVKAFAREHRVSLLVGAVTRQGESYYNSALLISPEGEVGPVYSKRHLVLFGEYVPFRKEFPFLASLVPIDDFTPGGEDVIFSLPNGAHFSVLICFEDTIAGLARRDAAKGADFLVNMTNDSWFRDSGQQRMHLENALFRAAENGRPLVRSTNTGESCAVADDGRVGTCIADAGGKRVLVEGVKVVRLAGSGKLSFYTKYGDVFTLLCCIGILSFVIGWAWISVRRRKK